MLAEDFLQDPQVRGWLEGVEPAWTLLKFDSLRAPRRGATGCLVQRTIRLRTGTQDTHRDLEAVIERNFLVQQERRGGRVVLRSFMAPALLLPADKGRAHLFHGKEFCTSPARSTVGAMT